MMPAFGFSVGDFINAIELCGKISKALKSTGGSASEYQQAILELESLRHVLSHLQALEPDASNVNHVNAIRGMALACMLPLQDFLVKIRKYEDTMGSYASRSIKGAANKAKWAIFIAEEVQKLRALVSAKVLSITLLLNTHTSETLSRLESRGGSQHNDLMSKILEHRTHLDDVSRIVEEVKKEAKRCHREFKRDVSSLANDVRSTSDNVMASSSSISGDLNIVSATVRATQSSLENVSKDLSNVSTALSSAQTTLMSLRDLGFQIKQFLCTFPAELRGLLRNILRTNMQMYFMLLNIHSSIGTSPSNQGSSKIKLEDALGIVRELPYEWFRHWEPFEGLLQAQFKNTPGRRKVSEGNFQLVHKRRPRVSIDKDGWTQSIAPGSEILMLVVFSALSLEHSSCPRPSCSGRPSSEMCQRALIECPECGLKYFPRPAALEDSPEALNIIMDERIREEQIEEDTELFGDRPAMLDPRERLTIALDTSQEDQDRMAANVEGEVDLRRIENNLLAHPPFRANGNTLRDPSKPANLANHIVLGEHPDIVASDISESLPSLATELSKENPLGFSAYTLGQGPSPLLEWLDQTVPPQNPTTVHRRRQERVDLQVKAKTQETEEIEQLRNVIIIPAPGEDEKVVLIGNDSKEDTQMPFGARIYYRNIVDRFPSAPKYLATRLAEANWARANRLGFAKFPTFNEGVSEPSNSHNMDVDSSLSSISFSDISHRSNFMQIASPSNEVNHLLPQSGSSTQEKVCYICNRGFRRVSQLKRHRERMHSVTGKFKCPECPLKFNKEGHCERHWHFEHSTVTYRCPECLEKLQSGSLLRTHIQQDHPNSIYALFGLEEDERKAREFLNKLDYQGSERTPRSDTDTDKFGDKKAPGIEHSKTTQLAARGRALSGNEYRDKRFISEVERLMQSLRTADYVHDTENQWSGSTGLQIDKNSPTGDHDRQSPPDFNRTGSASSLDFWSGKWQHSRAESVSSSTNNSLHGYEVFDAREQNIASPLQSVLGAGSEAQVSLPGFRLPHPPVELDKISSFECDICGKKVSIKRKREWRKHVLEDLKPYICIFEDCSSPLEAFSRRRDFLQHELNVHGKNNHSHYLCRLPGCGARSDGHSSALKHQADYHANHIDSLFGPGRSVFVTVVLPTCPLCQEPVPHQLGRHVGRHMEEISFAVVTKPYEDWDFYDGSSGSSQAIDVEELVKRLDLEAMLLKLKEWHEARDAAIPPPPEEKKAPVRFHDAIGRKFNFPFHMCTDWTSMEALIRQAFEHIKDIGPHVLKGHYNLKGPDSEIFIPLEWDRTIEPGMEITMHMWPCTDPSSGKCKPLL